MKRKQISEAERDSELERLDLFPKREGQKRADDLLRSLLSTPPEPFTPTPKAKKRAKRG